MACVWCGWDPPERHRTVEHLLPRSRGGTTNDANCVLACRDCNGRRKSAPAIAYVRARSRARGAPMETHALSEALEALAGGGTEREREYAREQSALIDSWREQVDRWGAMAI